MARIVAISSQVARGAIGLSAAVPALQALGHEVIALPTILLSNHPGHPRFAGERVAPDLLGRMLDALDANGWLASVDAVLTGYLPSAEHVAFAARAVDLIRERSGGALYVCDPVLGDEPKGLYIAEAAAMAIRAHLVPRADVVKMNQFECGWLGDTTVAIAGDVVRVAGQHGWRSAIVTSLPVPGRDELANVLIDGASEPREIRVPRRGRVPNGTGDLMGALWLGHRLSAGAPGQAAWAFESAVAGVENIIAGSVGRDELQLVAGLGDLRDAALRCAAEAEAGVTPLWVAGVDGCPAGWMVVLRDARGLAPPQARIVATFADVLALPEAPQIIAVDMPIGLPERSGIGGRAPDVAARAVLGKRQSSVFAVPARAAVMASDYAGACAAALLSSDPPRKIAKQSFNLFPRIRDIDALMTPSLQARVFECHPEVAFWAMNGQSPLVEPKKVKSRPHAAGLAFRRNLLVAGGFPVAFLEQTTFRAAVAGPDDFLDACACAWTATRLLAGTALVFPPQPPLDAKGLRQEIRA